MYLIDTNVWLERLLEQERSEEVRKFFDRTPSDNLFITDFAFHSIGIILCRLKQTDAFSKFVKDAFIDGAVVLVHLEIEDILHLLSAMSKFNFDFDDAYQYVAAQKYNLTLVSFDSDFDRTDLGRKTPGEII
ncbi:MAG: type II toxin-antitoxin system VapC family toxin [Nitrospinae bacterium]|nr:type II toxin-antitoxin system VapC family toxin [Nitrospinota bacterium]